MKEFNENGVYIKKSDANIEGYEIYGGNGKFVRKKYGLLNKLYDIHRYGKTREISYSYLYFLNLEPDTNFDVVLYWGSICGEFSEIFNSFKKSKRRFADRDIQKFVIIDESKIKYLDSKNRECFLTSFRSGSLIKRDFYDFVTNEKKSDEFNFYPFE